MYEFDGIKTILYARDLSHVAMQSPRTNNWV